jgi:hypothetical protein
MPFYDGSKENVIPVYDNSYYFEGYVAQGYKCFCVKNITHYFFIADDMIINPAINENNYADFFNLDEETCFIPALTDFPRDEFWGWHRYATYFNPFDKKNERTRGVELGGFLPKATEAMEILKKWGIQNRPYSLKMYTKSLLNESPYRRIKTFLKDWIICRMPFGKMPNYPLTSSYSDIFIVSQSDMAKFAHLCGCFASARLFVEIAIPTALALSAKKIITEKQLELKGQGIYSGFAIEESLISIIDSCSYDLSLLIERFPKTHLYLHPIKLSKWDIKNLL